MVKIPYNRENIIQCLCPSCQVQQNSGCVKEKMLNIQEIFQGEDDLKPQDYPGMYCAGGKADCQDLETHKICICPECTIYKKFNLENAHPTFLYCKDGKAQD